MLIGYGKNLKIDFSGELRSLTLQNKDGNIKVDQCAIVKNLFNISSENIEIVNHLQCEADLILRAKKDFITHADSEITAKNNIIIDARSCKLKGKITSSSHIKIGEIMKLPDGSVKAAMQAFYLEKTAVISADHGVELNTQKLFNGKKSEIRVKCSNFYRRKRGFGRRKFAVGKK